MDDQIQNLINQLELLLKEKKYNEMLLLLPDAVLEESKSAVLYAWRAKAHDKLNEADNTFFYANKSIEIDSSLALSYLVRGRAWADKDEYDKAIEDYSKAIGLDNNYIIAYCNRALAWAHKKEYDRAIEDFSKTIDLDNSDTFAYYNRGLTWAHKKEYDKVIQDCSKALSVDEKDVDSYVLRGFAWHYKNEFDKAIEDYSIAIDINDKCAEAYCNRGFSWYKKNNYEKAIKDFTESISINENSATPFYGLFLIYKNLEKQVIALQYLNKATQLHYKKLSKLIEAYCTNFFAPFMLKKVLNRVSNTKKISSLLETYINNQQYCENWERILYIQSIIKEKEKNELIFIRIKALINYFMGDCIESFEIFDSDIDNSLYSMNLRDQYYFIRSAQSFREPYDGILTFALKQVETSICENMDDLYYAGQLYLVKNDSNSAEKYFLRAAGFGFRPALYQLASLYNKVLYSSSKRNDIIEKILRYEKKNADKYSFINGIKPITIDNELNLLNTCYDICKYYAYYSENLEEIQLVRNFLNINDPFKHYEFWEMPLITEEANDNFNKKINQDELILFEKTLVETFKKCCKDIGEENIQKRIDYSSQATDVSVDIAKALENPKSKTSYEQELAKKIKDMIRLRVHAKWFLVFCKLYYLQGKLDIKSAICLHLYAEELAIKYKDDLIWNEVNQEMQVWLKYLVSLSIPRFTNLIFKAFKLISDGFKLPKNNEDDYSDYLTYKENWYHNLEFWRNSIISRLAKESGLLKTDKL